MVPAEVRLFEANDFQTNESTLTGESTPVDKNTKPVELNNPLPHQLSNTALMGSTVTNGSGTGLVVATGLQTYFGKTASSLYKIPPLTDFQKNISSLGSLIVRLVMILSVFVFVINSVLGKGILDSLVFSLAVTVGIMPEALPVIITIGLSTGALKLAKKKVIIKKLEAIENLGNMDVLCTDKTGTITRNEITVQEVLDLQGNSRPDLIKYGLLCNLAVVEGEKVTGDPIDVAIWKYAQKMGYDEATVSGFSCVYEIPFKAIRRTMSTVVEQNGIRILISKGAPEAILALSSNVDNGIISKTLSQPNNEINSLINKYRQTGSRIIALAYKEVEEKSNYAENERDLTFAGFLVLNDPPKEDAAKAITRFKSLAIKLKILSGDDPLVTADVCQKVGIGDHERVITGVDIENKSESELRKLAEDFDIFGRITPDQKLSIVKALKENGHVAGFLGDGVNDAPALKIADVGISVDSGVPVAKEVSSIILLEKSLEVVAEGVVEGRKAFGNMVKYIMNTMSGNFSNMLTIALSSLFLPFIPMLPVQILLVNLLTDAPLLAISTDSLDEENLTTPRKWNARSLVKFMVFFGIIDTIFDFIMIISLVYILHTNAELFRTGWFIESVLHEIISVFAIRTRRSFYKSKPSNPLILTSAIFAVITLIVVYSPIGLFFSFAAPPLWFLSLIFGVLILYFMLIETSKHVFFNRYDVSEIRNF